MKIKHSKESYSILFLCLIFSLTLLYSFTLAYKRYSNFEYGKFDLGNMAQVVWNTSHGRFMEVTDQFGSNMPRWGMSHVDPILIIFAPIYWLYDHPMIIVFFQHLSILSAIFPLYLLTKMRTSSRTTAFLVVLAYIVYPANGFALVWSGFHGISFVAPFLIWLVWLLEKKKYLISANFQENFFYWALIILMLMGKEEVGVILGLTAMFIFFKNRRLGLATFVISIVWSLISFSVLIPHYSNLRIQSVDNFVNKLNIKNTPADGITSDNFFIYRYSYLGNSYSEMLKTAILNPTLIIKVAFEKNKLNALNNMLGPLGYISAIVPFWLVSSPDLAVVLLSKDEIFDISNHRIAFVVVNLFISYVFLLGILKRIKYLSLFLSIVVLVACVYFSETTQNPLYVTGKSFITNKIVPSVLAQTGTESIVYTIGESRPAKVPRNEIGCLNSMADLLASINPAIYSGPDYLGAHSANRYVNALFPSRYWDADLVIADVFETKAVERAGASSWQLNKNGMRELFADDRLEHVFSCGKLNAFMPGKTRDIASIVETPDDNFYTLQTRNLSMRIYYPVDIPTKIKKESDLPIKIKVSLVNGDFRDKTTFWTFENKDNPDIKSSFIDYLSIASNEGIDKIDGKKISLEEYYPKLGVNFQTGEYRVFYGAGDLLKAAEVYIGNVVVE